MINIHTLAELNFFNYKQLFYTLLKDNDYFNYVLL